jgi:hypothetical protein
MANIDLLKLTKGEVGMLTGHIRGKKARELFDLDELDSEVDRIVVLAPSSLDTITPSFVQGLLGASMQALGPQRLRERFDLSQLPNILKDDFETGIKRLELHLKRTRSALH